ncbi:MAG: gliding motility-associated C-terminal domain-containing protein [Elusimicrobiota bacterium]|jgi:flagellar hook assembly protein FlgD
MRIGWARTFAAVVFAASTLSAASRLSVQMSGRVLTPNGDGINDAVTFNIQSDQESSAQATVINVQGRRVVTLLPEASGRYQWNGRDETGRVVESGVYLVQIVQNSSLFNGVVAVAR